MDALLHLGLSNALLASLLAVLAAAVAAVCRRPALAHALWLLVLLKLLTPPLLPVALPWPAPGAAPVVPARPEPAPAPSPQAARLPDAAPRAGERPAAPAEGAAAAPLPWQGVVLGCWLAGSCLWWAVAAARVARFRRLLRLAVPAPAATQEQARRLAARLGLAHCPSVWLVPACVSPLLWALGRAPRLLLPAELWQRLTPEQRDTLLAHELAHLRRGDPWVRRLELLALGLYWWHPVAWWARRELAAAAEECCDAWVVWALPEAAPAYAAALLETIAFLSRARRPVPLAASGAGHLRTIKRRLTMILRGPRPRTLSAAGALAVLGLAAVLLPLLPTWAEELPPAPAAAPDRDPDPATGDRPPAPRPEPKGAPKAAPRPLADVDPALAEEVQGAKDAVELLEAQLLVKRAQRDAARVALRSATDLRNKLSRTEPAGAVRMADLIQAEQEVARLQAQLSINEAELREPELRLRQALRRLAALERRARAAVVDPAANEAWAEALFDRGLTFNCGNVQRGLQIAYQFDLTNRTSGPIRIAAVRSSSAAVTVQHVTTELRPGQRGLLTGTVNTGRLSGNTTVLLRVEFSHPRAAEVKLAIHVNSVPARPAAPLPEEGKSPTDRERFLELEKKLGDILKEMESLRKRLPAPKTSPDMLEVNHRSFDIPFAVRPPRTELRELRLYCSANEGRTWEQVAILRPDERAFRFVAPADGVYWFNVAAVDLAGKQSPEDVTRQPPALKVRVNTAP